MAATGAELLDLPGPPGGLDLAEGMRALAGAGLTTVLVEGGGGWPLRSCARIWSTRYTGFWLPGWWGRWAPGPGGFGVQALSQTPRLEWLGVGRLGDDIHIKARRRSGVAETT